MPKRDAPILDLSEEPSSVPVHRWTPNRTGPPTALDDRQSCKA